MGAGNDNAFVIREKEPGNGLRHGKVRRSVPKKGLGLGVVTADHIADNDDVGGERARLSALYPWHTGMASASRWVLMGGYRF